MLEEEKGRPTSLFCTRIWVRCRHRIKWPRLFLFQQWSGPLALCAQVRCQFRGNSLFCTRCNVHTSKGFGQCEMGRICAHFNVWYPRSEENNILRWYPSIIAGVPSVKSPRRFMSVLGWLGNVTPVSNVVLLPFSVCSVTAVAGSSTTFEIKSFYCRQWYSKLKLTLRFYMLTRVPGTIVFVLLELCASSIPSAKLR